jgi:pyruvate formate-lyase activating enzyme-like uncharacterized protein
MITEINHATLSKIKNPELRAYARRYVEIYSDFLAQIARFGLELEAHDGRPQVAEQLDRLRQKGAHLRNDDKSIYINSISPACLACRTGIGSATYFVSLRCHRDCFYCFNPNQENYEHFTAELRDASAELDSLAAQRAGMQHLALTGGEPLLYKDQTLSFFRTARRKFPRAYTRLYTSGDQADAVMLSALKEAGLQEIRFSVRMHDTEKARRHTLKRIAQAKEYIPYVMVEMPVLPDKREEMKSLLTELDRIGIFSINLLELCFPLNNVVEFQRRGYHIKIPPYRVLYDYWYAGGLPIAGSEELCLDLLEFALDSGFKMGVHYCSLENKHTGQVYQQNHVGALSPTIYGSKKDFFLKTAKVFGKDIPQAKEALQRKRKATYQEQADYGYLEFNPRHMRALANLEVEVGISTNVLEQRAGEQVMRELKVDVTTPQVFDLSKDL